MTCNHQKEITELKRQHQQDLLDAVEEARQKHEIMEMTIRDTYAQDREVAIEKERNAIRERYNSLFIYFRVYTSVILFCVTNISLNHINNGKTINFH